MINSRLSNLALKTPIRDLKGVLKKLCDYDLLATAEKEYRIQAYRMMIAEAKRRGLLCVPLKLQENANPNQTAFW